MEEEYKEKIESALKFLQPKEEEEQEEEEDDDDRLGILRPIEEEEDYTPSQESGERRPSESQNDLQNLVEGNEFDRMIRYEGENEAENENEEEEEDINVRMSKVNVVDAEDESFLQEFDKMMYDSLQQRIQEQVKPPQVDFSVPVNIKTKMKARFGK